MRLVADVSDDKSLPKEERKRRQVEHATHISTAAQQIKIADKLCNLREILSNPPTGWSVCRVCGGSFYGRLMGVPNARLVRGAARDGACVRVAEASEERIVDAPPLDALAGCRGGL